MSHVFSSRYFSLIKADKLQREDPICVSISLFSVKHSLPLYDQNCFFPYTRNRKQSSKEVVDMLTVKLSRMCFIYFLHYVLCRKSFPTHQRKIDSVSSSSRKPHFKQTGRLKSREKSIRYFFIQVERGKEIDQCNFSDTRPSNNENNLSKSRP